jgi:DNA-binding transcriptional MerR regulator
MSQSDADTNAKLLQEIAEVRGDLKTITALLQHQSQSSERRHADLKEHLSQRLDSHERRIENLEKNERSTAIKAAGLGVLSSALVTAGIAALKGMK